MPSPVAMRKSLCAVRNTGTSKVMKHCLNSGGCPVATNVGCAAEMHGKVVEAYEILSK